MDVIIFMLNKSIPVPRTCF